MEKINFTEEHQARLKELAVELLLAGILIEGIAGTKYNVHDLLHEVSLNTLSTMHSNIKKSITKIEDMDDWSMTDYQQKKLAEQKKMKEFIHLIIGWKKMQSQVEADKKKIAELKEKLKVVKEETMSPKERVELLEKKIREKGGDLGSDEENE